MFLFYSLIYLCLFVQLYLFLFSKSIIYLFVDVIKLGVIFECCFCRTEKSIRCMNDLIMNCWVEQEMLLAEIKCTNIKFCLEPVLTMMFNSELVRVLIKCTEVCVWMSLKSKKLPLVGWILWKSFPFLGFIVHHWFIHNPDFLITLLWSLWRGWA